MGEQKTGVAGKRFRPVATDTFPRKAGRNPSSKGRVRTGRKKMKNTSSQAASDRLLCRELFRGLPAETSCAFEALQTRTSYPEGATLFVNDQKVPGVFVLHAGSVELSEPGGQGKSGKSRIAFPGEILEVPATVAGDPCRVAAQTREPSEIGFIDRRAFENFLCRHNAAAFRLVQLLSNAVARAMDRARSLPVCAC